MPWLTAREMRSLLRSTGTPQSLGVPIGTQPNLQAALRAMLPDSGVLRIADLPQSVAPGQAVTGTVTARNTGGRTWTSSSHHVECKWQDADVPVAVGSLGPPASVDVGDTARPAWTTTAPAVPPGSAMTLRCALIADGRVIASTTAGTLVASANQFAAEITEFRLPASARYSVVEPQPAVGHITVRNTGTEDWTGQWLAQLELRTSPKQESWALPDPVAAGDRDVDVEVFCQSAGPNTFTARMLLSGVQLAPAKQATTTCLRG